jgi:hypothetical protein
MSLQDELLTKHIEKEKQKAAEQATQQAGGSAISGVFLILLICAGVFISSSGQFIKGQENLSKLNPENPAIYIPKEPKPVEEPKTQTLVSLKAVQTELVQGTITNEIGKNLHVNQTQHIEQTIQFPQKISPTEAKNLITNPADNLDKYLDAKPLHKSMFAPKSK